jgi:hypothetical protein
LIRDFLDQFLGLPLIRGGAGDGQGDRSPSLAAVLAVEDVEAATVGGGLDVTVGGARVLVECDIRHGCLEGADGVRLNRL